MPTELSLKVDRLDAELRARLPVTVSGAIPLSRQEIHGKFTEIK